MTVANGSPILKADLDALATSSLAFIRSANARAPLGHQVQFHFADLVASTAETRRKAVFVVPFDCYIESVGLVGCDMSGTLAVSITGDGALPSWPITVSGVMSSGVSKSNRIFYDGTKGSLQDFGASSRAFRVWPRGSTITLVASTTSTATPSRASVVVVMRSFLGRL